MDFADTLAELETTIGDAASITFTPEEKTRALKKAWNDSYVVKTVIDSTTLWATNTFSYAVPTTLRTVKDVYTQQNVVAGTESISADLWEVVDGQLIFRTAATSLFNPGDAIYIKGNYKYDYLSDTITDTSLQEYIIASAGFNTLSLLGFKKANLFLKNDTSMSELIGLRRELDAERKELRAKLHRETQGA